MSKSGSPWQDARRAWERLAGWHRNLSAPPPDQPDRTRSGDGDALIALTDIGIVRRQLDRVELEAVRAARHERRSWAEIATRLGVSRQSAWERWRELDEEVAGQPAPAAGLDPGTDGDPDGKPDLHPSLRLVADSKLGRVAHELIEDATEQITGTRKRLRRHSVVVPSVIGLPWYEARLRLSAVSLIGVGPDPDGPPVPVDATDSSMVVTGQEPPVGDRVAIGSLVRLQLERGGGSAGVREPRRPVPSPKPAREAPHEPTGETHHEPAGEAVG